MCMSARFCGRCADEFTALSPCVRESVLIIDTEGFSGVGGLTSRTYEANLFGSEAHCGVSCVCYHVATIPLTLLPFACFPLAPHGRILSFTRPPFAIPYTAIRVLA